MTDDEDDQEPAGEFPPGLEGLSAGIERLARSQRRSEDIREDVARIADQAAPFVNEARRALDQAQGDTDGFGGRIRDALSAVSSQATAMLSGTGSLTIGGTMYAAATLTGSGTLTAGGSVLHGQNAVVLSDEGVAMDSLTVQKSRSMLDRLPPAYIFYIVLIWLLVAGVGVVIERFKLPPDVVEQLQTDPNYASLALDLTILLLAYRKRLTVNCQFRGLRRKPIGLSFVFELQRVGCSSSELKEPGCCAQCSTISLSVGSRNW